MRRATVAKGVGAVAVLAAIAVFFWWFLGKKSGETSLPDVTDEEVLGEADDDDDGTPAPSTRPPATSAPKLSPVPVPVTTAGKLPGTPPGVPPAKVVRPPSSSTPSSTPSSRPSSTPQATKPGSGTRLRLSWPSLLGADKDLAVWAISQHPRVSDVTLRSVTDKRAPAIRRGPFDVVVYYDPFTRKVARVPKNY